VNKLDTLLRKPHINTGKISDWTDKTVDRVIDIIEGKGEQWLRMSTDYRKYSKEAKY
jgi:ribosomal protein S10